MNAPLPAISSSREIRVGGKDRAADQRFGKIVLELRVGLARPRILGIEV